MTEPTRRELQVLTGVAQGKTQNVVAQDLGISPYTVHRHLNKVYTKLDAQCAIDALRAIGWLRIPSLILALILVAGCSSTPSTEATDPLPVASLPPGDKLYAVDFAPYSASVGAFVVIAVPCSQQPHSPQDVLVYCVGPATVSIVDEATWNAANPGDPWPPEASPS